MRHGDLIVSALVPGATGPGLSPSRGQCVVFLGKTLNFVTSFMKQNKSRKQTLESAQNGLEIIFKVPL